MGIKSVNVDDEIWARGKIRIGNMSQFVENEIKKKLLTTEVEIEKEIDHCEICGKKEEKATKDNIRGLTWLYPDEKWICSSCLKLIATKIAHA